MPQRAHIASACGDQISGETSVINIKEETSLLKITQKGKRGTENSVSFALNVCLAPSVFCRALPLAQTNTRLLVSQRPLAHLWPVTQHKQIIHILTLHPECVPGTVRMSI